MTLDQYVLNDRGEPRIAASQEESYAWYAKADRNVAKTKIGKSLISTVFLWIDHGYRTGPPVLWETMVFGGPLDMEEDRCSGSREQAIAMHAAMVKRVQAAGAGPRLDGTAVGSDQTKSGGVFPSEESK